jgi:hypothetical protein
VAEVLMHLADETVADGGPAPRVPR